MSIKRILGLGVGTGTAAAAAAMARLSWRFVQGKKEEDLTWALGHYAPLSDVGAVNRLTVLPLIDHDAVNEGLQGEPGVSYLIRADETTILFDVGLNHAGEHPSPLLQNMDALDVRFDDIDMLVFSHAHPDHLGGMRHVLKHTFAPSAGPVDLHGVPAYVPEPLHNPSARSVVVKTPRVLAPGVATTGPIHRQLFFFGWTPEQSLAINVAGKGIVLVIGCGHPTLQRIVERAEMLFAAPVYGVIGGLHYPVTASRVVKFGLPVQQILGTGKWPWDPINEREVLDAITFLRRRQPRLVSLSPHDSCDWSLSAFRNAFGDAYSDLIVGRPISVTA